jgi:hypothetical protein
VLGHNEPPPSAASRPDRPWARSPHR